MTAALHEYCTAQLRKMIEEQTESTYPKLDVLVFEGGKWKAKLWANPDDDAAECVIEENFKTVLQRGLHPLAKRSNYR